MRNRDELASRMTKRERAALDIQMAMVRAKLVPEEAAEKNVISGKVVSDMAVRWADYLFDYLEEGEPKEVNRGAIPPQPQMYTNFQEWILSAQFRPAKLLPLKPPRKWVSFKRLSS